MSETTRLDKMIQLVAEQAIEKSSQVLSKLLKQGAKIELKQVSLMDIALVTEKMNEEDKEVVAAFIGLEGDAPFKFLFSVGMADALQITDLFLGQETGTTIAFDDMTASAVQEVGNILSSAISNVFSQDFQVEMKPTPPEVIQDYLGTLFQQFIMDLAMESDQILIIESKFKIVRSELDCYMYLLPLAGSTEALGMATGMK